MKKYLSIPHQTKDDLFFTVFDKLDGSNIRAEWSPKKGFYKFGSRKVLINSADVHLGNAVALIKEKEELLTKIFEDQKFNKNVVCFFEYYGERSFAGNHHDDDNHQVTLIDVSPYKQGLIPPRLFIRLFEEVGIPNIVHQGYADADFIQSVKDFVLDGITLEGVVCKAPNPNGKKTSQPVMFKIKTEKWLELLREFVNYDEALFERLR